MGGDEVLQHREALTEVRLDGPRNDVALGVGHQTSHGGDLTHLGHVSTGTGVHHHVDGVGAGEVGLHRLGELGSGLRPDLDEVLTPLLLGDGTTLVLLVDLGSPLLVARQDLRLGRRGLHVTDGHGHTGQRAPVVADVLEVVEDVGHLELGHPLGEVVDDLADLLLADQVVDVGVVLGQHLVEDRLTQGGVEQDGAVRAQLLAHRRNHVVEAHLDLGAHLEFTEIMGHDRLGQRGEDSSLTLAAVQGHRQVVGADDHLVAGQGDRPAVSRLEDVVGREHEHPSLGLGLGAQRQVDGHLVTVEVGVEGRADQRVQLDGLALDEQRLEGLDAQTVQRWCSVEQHRVLLDDLFEDVPHHRALTLDHPLGGLDVLGVLEVCQTLHDERLEQLQGHRLGQTALVHLELRTDDDDRTAGVVDALAEQILAESALLALEHVGQRLQRTVARTGDRTSATTVVEQRVHGLLEHALLVVDDDLGGSEIEQSLETVVAIDDATVEVVEVGGGESATVELDHRAQVRRDHRHAVQHHARRGVAGIEEGLHHLETLEGTSLLLAASGLDGLTQALRLGLQVEVGQTTLDGLGTHGALEVLAEPRTHLTVEHLVTLEILDLEGLEPLPDGVETVDLTLTAMLDLTQLLLGTVLDLAAGVGLGPLGLQLSEVLLELCSTSLQLGVAALGHVGLLGLHLRLEARQVAVTGLLVDRGDHVGREVDDLLEVLGGDVEQVAQPRRHTLEVPDVGDRGGQLDVAHALTAHVGASDLHATALTDDALEAHALVLAAVALPVLGGPEDLLAEQSVALRFESAVVDGLGFLDLAVAPLANLVSGRQADLEAVVVVRVQHGVSLSPTAGGCWLHPCPGGVPTGVRVTSGCPGLTSPPSFQSQLPIDELVSPPARCRHPDDVTDRFPGSTGCPRRARADRSPGPRS